MDILPLSEIKPGMQGIGKTVFSGEQVEEFGVQVLDIVKNIYPRTDMILVRLTGSRVEQTGVVSGMSGSPVYIDGKLVGALAMRFGDFPKEPIAGIMPIAYMLQVADKEKAHEQERSATFSLHTDFLNNTLCGTRDGFWLDLVQSWCGRTPELQNRIESPLVFSGFSASVLADVDPWVRTMGFKLMSGGGSTAAGFVANGRLEPGDAVSQVFVSGDLGIDATGTVTAVQGNRVLAFGHHVFNLGPINLPMARSRILTTLSSLMGSSKMSTSLEILGCMRQDRMAAMYGELGTAPPQIPITLTTEAPQEGKTVYRLYLANDPAVNNLLPMFLRMAVFQCMVSARLAALPSSILLDAQIKLADGQSIVFQDFFSSEQQLGFMGAGMEAADASDLIANVLGVIQVNDFNPPAVKEITLQAKLLSGRRYARIRRLVQNRSHVTPGDSVQATIELLRSDGRTLNLHKSFALSKTITSSSITLLAASGGAMTLSDLQTNPDKFRPGDFSDLSRLIQTRRRNDRLYIQWRVPAAGMVVNGRELAALPPSIMGVMNHNPGGEDRPLHERILAEEEISLDMEAVGFKRIVFHIEQPRSLPTQRDAAPEPSLEW